MDRLTDSELRLGEETTEAEFWDRYGRYMVGEIEEQEIMDQYRSYAQRCGEQWEERLQNDG